MPFYHGSTSTRHHRRHRKPSLRARVAFMEANFRPENKWLDVLNSTLAVTSTPNLIALDPVPQGDGQSERVGDVIKATSSFLRLTLSRGTVDSFVRMIFFVWKSDDVPTGGTAILTNTATITSPLNRDFAQTFRVISDKIYALGTGESQVQVDEIWKKLWCRIRYDSDTVTTTSMNGYYVLLLSDQVAGVTAPVLNFYHRLSYTDA